MFSLKIQNTISLNRETRDVAASPQFPRLLQRPHLLFLAFMSCAPISSCYSTKLSTFIPFLSQGYLTYPVEHLLYSSRSRDFFPTSCCHVTCSIMHIQQEQWQNDMWHILLSAAHSDGRSQKKGLARWLKNETFLGSDFNQCHMTHLFFYVMSHSGVAFSDKKLLITAFNSVFRTFPIT